MPKYLLKDIIIDMLCNENEILMNAFMNNPKFKSYAHGDNYMAVTDRDNWLIMDDINVACGQAFRELLNEGMIVLKSVRADVALAGGDFYELPICDTSKKHHSLHWLPLKAIKGPNFPVT